jgi:hypothetical protein
LVGAIPDEADPLRIVPSSRPSGNDCAQSIELEQLHPDEDRTFAIWSLEMLL